METVSGLYGRDCNLRNPASTFSAMLFWFYSTITTTSCINISPDQFNLMIEIVYLNEEHTQKTFAPQLTLTISTFFFAHFHSFQIKLQVGRTEI